MNVRTICLGYLSLREATGYEIKKDFEDGMFCHFTEASFGSIYPALSQLAAEGLLTVRQEEQPGKPDRKVYSITPNGIETLSKALAVVPSHDKFRSEFLFVMLLRQHITPAQQRIAIEKQLSDLRSDLAKIAQCRMSHEPDDACEFVSGYGEAVLTAAVNYLEQHLATQSMPMSSLAAE